MGDGVLNSSGNKVDLISEIRFPHSLGLHRPSPTSRACCQLGVQADGSGSLWRPRFVDLIYENLIDGKDDGSFRLNMDYFDYCTGFKMTSEKFSELFGRNPASRNQKSPMDMDLAASIQKVTEEVVLKIARHVQDHQPQEPSSAAVLL